MTRLNVTNDYVEQEGLNPREPVPVFSSALWSGLSKAVGLCSKRK
jgi:hypothetical protein